MDCTDQHNSEHSCSSPAAVSALREATGDSESDDLLPADGSSVDADDIGDAESCSGGEDGGSVELGVVVSWECWMTESASAAVGHMAAVGGDDGVCPEAEDAAAGADAESDRLFWEACIAHGY